MAKWSVIVNGHVSKETRTKRGADRWTRVARGAGLDSRTERTQKCGRCGLHRCGGAAKCRES